MKIVFSTNDFQLISPFQFLRQAGYHALEDRRSQNLSFVRRLGANFYPRLHIYLQNIDDKVIFNLHLDQKKASYEGQKAHSGEYDSELVKEEALRLKLLLKKLILK